MVREVEILPLPNPVKHSLKAQDQTVCMESSIANIDVSFVPLKPVVFVIIQIQQTGVIFWIL
jgi:hypothetical protein